MVDVVTRTKQRLNSEGINFIFSITVIITLNRKITITLYSKISIAIIITSRWNSSITIKIEFLSIQLQNYELQLHDFWKFWTIINLSKCNWLHSTIFDSITSLEFNVMSMTGWNLTSCRRWCVNSTHCTN